MAVKIMNLKTMRSETNLETQERLKYQENDSAKSPELVREDGGNKRLLLL